MKKALLLLFLVLAGVSPVSAELRVLFRFNENGHSVHRVVDLATRQAIMSKGSAARTPLHGFEVSLGNEVRRRLSETGLVNVIWWDINGARISTTEVPDPRITRSPAHVDGSVSTFAALKAGGWMVTGPGNAVAVSVFFPSYLELGLNEAHWQASLAR